MTTPLKPTEAGNYNDFRIRMALRILKQPGRTEQDVMNYWAHLDDRPGA